MNIICTGKIGNHVAAEPESFCWCVKMFFTCPKLCILCCVVSRHNHRRHHTERRSCSWLQRQISQKHQQFLGTFHHQRSDFIYLMQTFVFSNRNKGVNIHIKQTVCSLLKTSLHGKDREVYMVVCAVTQPLLKSDHRTLVA